jgi:hypoxanthine-DNA glycosylase
LLLPLSSKSKFWWIAGDCLGFRRGTGISPFSGEPYKFAVDLRHDNILPYEKQIETFIGKGFALWDIVASCERDGSLDADIQGEKPNDIRGFCEKHPSIRRIVLANGTSGCGFFRRHFGDWLDSGGVVPCSHPATQTKFKKWVVPKFSSSPQAIKLISALAVSPAAAMYSYSEKRDFWDEFVYKPGLADFEAARRAARKRKIN